VNYTVVAALPDIPVTITLGDGVHYDKHELTVHLKVKAK
jgi:hypothetical protein